MHLKIVQAGEPVLRQRANPLTAEQLRSSAIQNLIELMRATMHDAPGVGLAAPQIGESLQLTVIEDRAASMSYLSTEALAEREREPIPFQVIANPILTITDASSRLFFEGCLSVSGFTMLVPRAQAVRVDCLNQHGDTITINASGWYARILQHEIDHLYGRLCIDCMLSRSFMSMDNYQRFWCHKSATELKQDFTF